VVEIEEDVYSFEPANNGAGPMWCHGSTCLVRIGDDVFASGLETLKDCKPLNNCRWTLFNREENGWKLLRADEAAQHDLLRWQALQQATNAQPSLTPSLAVKQKLLLQFRQEKASRRWVFEPARFVSVIMLALSVLILSWVAFKPGIVLEWSLENGGVSAFRVYRAPEGNPVFQLLEEIPAQPDMQQYFFVDPLLLPGQTYIYRIEGISQGSRSVLSQVITGNWFEILPLQLLMIFTSVIIGWGIVTLVTLKPMQRWGNQSIVRS